VLIGVATTAAPAVWVWPSRVVTVTESSRLSIPVTDDPYRISAAESSASASISDAVPSLSFSLTATYQATALFSNPATQERMCKPETSEHGAPK
jgi:hypothetical protein